MEHNSVIKRNEVLIHTTTWLNSYKILCLVGKNSETLKNQSVLILLIQHFLNDKILKLEDRAVVAEAFIKGHYVMLELFNILTMMIDT